MAERTSSGLLTMMLDSAPAVGVTLPAEVREKLAELELELSEGKWTSTRKGAKISCWRVGSQRKTTALHGQNIPPLVESVPFIELL